MFDLAASMNLHGITFDENTFNGSVDYPDWSPSTVERKVTGSYPTRQYFNLEVLGRFNLLA